jgi:hypothetical protein
VSMMLRCSGALRMSGSLLRDSRCVMNRRTCFLLLLARCRGFCEAGVYGRPEKRDGMCMSAKRPL